MIGQIIVKIKVYCCGLFSTESTKRDPCQDEHAEPKGASVVMGVTLGARHEPATGGYEHALEVAGIEADRGQSEDWNAKSA